MKSLVKTIAIAIALIAPVASFAQSNQPLTRAQVRADLVRLEKAGYNPRDWMHYPDNAQAAEARVSAEQAVNTSGYGESMQGASQAGHHVDEALSSYSPPIYIHN